jgi:hypothetical protein
MMETFAHIDLTSELDKMTVPSLLLLGDSGMLGSKAPEVSKLVKEFRKHCNHCKMVTIRKAGGTYCMFEKPKETAAEVRRFIKGLR